MEEEFIPTAEHPVMMTDAALEIAHKAIAEEGEEGDGIRVSVIGRGCSGFRYQLDFEKVKKDNDTVVMCDDIALYIDNTSLEVMRGTVIDYVVNGEFGTGFKFNNPNVGHGCAGCSGCGE